VVSSCRQRAVASGGITVSLNGSEKVSFDLWYRVFGQILSDLGHDQLLNVGVESAAQIGERSGRRGNDERWHVAAAHHIF
jgi:hypothetical protein